MRESFLHYLWRTRRFDMLDLQTTLHQSVQILHPGEYNTHSGPDFFNARLSIDGTLWAGNVEMHLYASEWLGHQHDKDPAYDSVILHVVLKEDLPVFRPDGSRIPCLELEHRIPEPLLHRYVQLESAQTWIPCQSSFADAPEIIKNQWLDRVLIERMEEKTKTVQHLLDHTGHHWEEVLYQTIARNFGLKINMDPIEMLARTLPIKHKERHRQQPHQLEALIFGQAGFLDAPFLDPYPQLLIREYHHLSHKYQLNPLRKEQWKFFRLRPSSFPTIRLAQFSALIQQTDHLLATLLECNSPSEMKALFKVTPANYWADHFQFDTPSIQQEKSLSKEFIDLLLINAVAPFLFFYGQHKGIDRPQDQAFMLLESLPPETNSMVKIWKTMGCTCSNAFQTQALIHLKTRYCDHRRCLDCAIGNALLK